MVIGPLGESGSLTLYPNFISCILVKCSRWVPLRFPLRYRF